MLKVGGNILEIWYHGNNNHKSHENEEEDQRSKDAPDWPKSNCDTEIDIMRETNKQT